MAQIDFTKIPKVLHNIEFNISGDPDWDPYGLRMTDACRRALGAAHAAVEHKETMGAQKIRNAIRRYPRVPMFKNHLWRFYLAVGHEDLALATAEAAMLENPEYFYGRLMLATCLMNLQRHIPEIPALMHQWNIVDYAGRSQFAAHEVLNYYLIAVEYHYKTGNRTEAQGYLYFLSVAGFDEDLSFQQVKNKLR